jgi:hypothetical protein
MMSKLKGNMLNKAMSFAHLAGLAGKASAEDDGDKNDQEAKSKAKAEDDEKRDQWAKLAEDDADREQAEEESDEDYKERMESMDDDEAKAEDQAPEDDDEKKSKKAKAEEKDEDEDKDAEMRGSSPVAKARLREQARCASIFASKAAGKNPALAANLAFKTRLTRSEALAILEETPASTPQSARSLQNPTLGPSGGGSHFSGQAAANRWDAAFSKANPNRK